MSQKRFRARLRRVPPSDNPVRATETSGQEAETLTARFALVDEAPKFDRGRIAEIRDRLRLSQPVFAAALNVSSETVKAWEQGKRVPDGAALRLLQLAEQRPEWILESVRGSGLESPARSPDSGRTAR